MCPSRRGTTRRNEARERSTTRRSELWAGTCAGSFIRCSRKIASTRFARKKGIPRPRSVRDRALKRKYGGRKSQAKKRNNRIYEQSAQKTASPLEISSGMIRPEY